MPKKQQHEAAEQEKLFRWAAFMEGRFPVLGLLHHIPNGGSRNRLEAANLKRQGVKAGVRMFVYLFQAAAGTDCTLK